MAPIPNLRLDQFARNLAKGIPIAKAFTMAGYADNPNIANAKAKDPMIQARVAELVAEKGGNESGIDFDDLVTSDKLDKDWVLHQMQRLFQDAKKENNFKIARDVLNDIAEVVGVKGNRVAPAGDNTNALPPPPAINLSILIEKLGKDGDSIDSLLEDAIDITPEDEELVRTTNFLTGPDDAVESDPVSDTVDVSSVSDETPRSVS